MRGGLDYERTDARLGALVTYAYEETKRLNEILKQTEWIEREVRATDSAEECLAAVLHALVGLDATIRSAEA